MTDHDLSLEWVVLTLGDRSEAVRAAVESLTATGSPVTIVANGCDPAQFEDVTQRGSVSVVAAPENLGVPGGRDLGVSATGADVIGFLDDDAVLFGGADAGAAIVEAFARDDSLGAIGLRLVDGDGDTSARHVPRLGGGSASRSGPVPTFLGGACAIRRTAYDGVGGYFTDLVYGHEELELSWRLHDDGWGVGYLADLTVHHPRTPISRHARGWWLTGRNRVWIARRSLPATVAVVHTTLWLAVGAMRAPTGCRSAYLSGWRNGWSQRWSSTIPRRPIGWGTVWRLTRLGRPPIV